MNSVCFPVMLTPSTQHRPIIASVRGEEWPSPAYTEIRRSRLLEALRRTLVDAERSSVFVDASALDYAVAFISLLPPEAPDPDIVIEEDGDVAFDWGSSAESTFSVSVGSDGTLRFGGLFGNGTRYGSEPLVSAIPNEILAYIDKARQTWPR